MNKYTNTEAWNPRPCRVCGEEFVPKTCNPASARDQVHCGRSCARANSVGRGVDPYHERVCEQCGVSFVPVTKYKQQAARQRFCSFSCSGKHCALQRDYSEGRTVASFAKPLADIDLTPCTRCGLRGHVADDPEKCFQSSELMHRKGLGSMWWTS